MVHGRPSGALSLLLQPVKGTTLDGAKISVKDGFDIPGHKKTLYNRTWIGLYPAETRTTNCIQTLIDAGAVIVGKVKLQAMIMREEPKEAIKSTAPSNARAGGYQVPSGSSHGSAAEIGAYDWLEFLMESENPTSIH